MPDPTTVAIGAPFNDGNGSNSGQVRVFWYNGTNWLQKGADIDGEAAEDASGISVDMPDANTVAIGATLNDGNGSGAGHVRVYSWTGGVWVQKGADIDGEAGGDQFGTSISMPNANTLAVGAQFNYGNGTNAGHVRIFSWNGSAWVQKGLDIDGEAIGDGSGWAVSMPDAGTVAIGARFNSGGSYYAGHVRIFNWNGSAWVQKGADIDGENSLDISGCAVSMPDANTVSIGAWGNDANGSNSGHARVFTWNGSAWMQKGADIDGVSAGDQAGISVSMPDANTIAVGGNLTDGNGINSGQTRIFKWNGTAWVQFGSNINGEGIHDESGRVSMPHPGVVAIGAHSNDGVNGINSGHVRIYGLQGPGPYLPTQPGIGR
jgi:hypothetical protein